MGVYLRLKNIIFRSILENRFDEAALTVELVFLHNPAFICEKNKDVLLNLIRDSGRILSLKLCSVLTQLVVKISKH